MLFCMIFIVAALIANVLEKSKTDKMARWIFPISFTVLRELFKMIQEFELNQNTLKFLWSLIYFAFYMSTRMSEGMDNMIIYES